MKKNAMMPVLMPSTGAITPQPLKISRLPPLRIRLIWKPDWDWDRPILS